MAKVTRKMNNGRLWYSATVRMMKTPGDDIPQMNDREYRQKRTTHIQSMWLKLLPKRQRTVRSSGNWKRGEYGRNHSSRKVVRLKALTSWSPEVSLTFYSWSRKEARTRLEGERMSWSVGCFHSVRSYFLDFSHGAHKSCYTPASPSMHTDSNGTWALNSTIAVFRRNILTHKEE